MTTGQERKKHITTFQGKNGLHHIMTPDAGTSVHNCTFRPVTSKIKTSGTFSIHSLHTLRKNTNCRKLKRKDINNGLNGGMTLQKVIFWG